MSDQPAEETSVTKPSVVAGLGFPNGREESSPQPTGWVVENPEITEVSRETSR
jgi:hypothetical protein